MTIRNTAKYIMNLPGKRKREAEVAKLEARFMDPNDPYRAADWAHNDSDPVGRSEGKENA